MGIFHETETKIRSSETLSILDQFEFQKQNAGILFLGRSLLEPMPTKEPLFCVRLTAGRRSPKAGDRPYFPILFDRLVPLCVVIIDLIVCPNPPVCSRSVCNRNGS